jgi:metal-responsive CopG/Arc/MetJ family transcriptional regulator
MTKTRILIQLDEDQLKALRGIRHKTGASVAEIIRRAIAKYLVNAKKGRRIHWKGGGIILHVK